MALAGAGNRDALLFRDGGTTYDLLRLRWRSASLHTYATAGEWVSSLIDGDDPTRGQSVARGSGRPLPRRTTAATRPVSTSVSFPLEYSIDGGLTWVDGRGHAGGERRDADPDAGRRLRATPPIVALAAAAAAVELGQRLGAGADESVGRVRGRRGVRAGRARAGRLRGGARGGGSAAAALGAHDRRRRSQVTRSGAGDAKTGRQAIAALWDAWELGTAVSFKDIDHDADPVTYLVAIVGMEEKAAKPADGARWGESTVTLILEESAPAGGGSAAGLALDDLADVTLGALTDGEVLT